MKKVIRIRIVSLVLNFVLIAGMSAVPLIVKAEGVENEVIWLDKNYDVSGTETYNVFHEGLAMVSINGKWGYIDKTGNEVIQPKYDRAQPFSEGLAAVLLNGKWGYINKSGNEVIPLQYDMAETFSEGLARVSLPGRADMCIDKTGKLAFKVEYGVDYDFKDGLALDWNENRKAGFIDKTGKVAIPYQYDGAESFSEGLASVYEISNSELGLMKYGLIDKTGRVVLPYKYDYIYRFHNGMAKVENGGLFGYIDNTGKEVIPCKYEDAENFEDGLAKVKLPSVYPKSGSVFSADSVVIEKYKYIDKTGKDILKPQYSFTDNFSEGLAIVSFNNQCGYIDKTGNVAIPIQYSKAYDFNEGVAFVKQGEKLGIIKNPLTSQDISANAIKASNTVRLAGNDRYETSVAISQKGWNQCGNVILTSGENYPDALVGSSFAYLKNAPVLITPSDKLDSSVSAEIARLQAKNVYILGSDTTISQNIDNELKQKYNVVRIGGTGLYDTAVNVGEEVRKIK
ncbi:WG repeat-containing protein [Clostridium sp. WILCCON 0269]|uniref:WG repeat-containing protein n=1 Tax=Candidatus Clostridium eludens TaxID=3381663 RepID=A0ABW8SE98_9CLOT